MRLQMMFIVRGLVAQSAVLLSGAATGGVVAVTVDATFAKHAPLTGKGSMDDDPFSCLASCSLSSDDEGNEEVLPQAASSSAAPPRYPYWEIAEHTDGMTCYARVKPQAANTGNPETRVGDALGATRASSAEVPTAMKALTPLAVADRARQKDPEPESAAPPTSRAGSKDPPPVDTRETIVFDLDETITLLTITVGPVHKAGSRDRKEVTRMNCAISMGGASADLSDRIQNDPESYGVGGVALGSDYRLRRLEESVKRLYNGGERVLVLMTRNAGMMEEVLSFMHHCAGSILPYFAMVISLRDPPRPVSALPGVRPSLSLLLPRDLREQRGGRTSTGSSSRKAKGGLFHPDEILRRNSRGDSSPSDGSGTGSSLGGTPGAQQSVEVRQQIRALGMGSSSPLGEGDEGSGTRDEVRDAASAPSSAPQGGSDTVFWRNYIRFAYADLLQHVPRGKIAENVALRTERDYARAARLMDANGPAGKFPFFKIRELPLLQPPDDVLQRGSCSSPTAAAAGGGRTPRAAPLEMRSLLQCVFGDRGASLSERKFVCGSGSTSASCDASSSRRSTHLQVVDLIRSSKVTLLHMLAPHLGFRFDSLSLVDDDYEQHLPRLSVLHVDLEENDARPYDDPASAFRLARPDNSPRGPSGREGRGDLDTGRDECPQRPMCRRVTEEADDERRGDKVAEPLSTASAVATPSPAGLTLTGTPTADSVLTASPYQVLAAHVEIGAGRPPMPRPPTAGHLRGTLFRDATANANAPPTAGKRSTTTKMHDLCVNDDLTRLRLGLPSSRVIGTGGVNSTSSAGCFPCDCEAGVVAGLRALRQKVAEKAGRTVKKMFFVQGADVNKKSSPSEKTPDSWWDANREEQLLNRGCLVRRCTQFGPLVRELFLRDASGATPLGGIGGCKAEIANHGERRKWPGSEKHFIDRDFNLLELTILGGKYANHGGADHVDTPTSTAPGARSSAEEAQQEGADPIPTPSARTLKNVASATSSSSTVATLEDGHHVGAPAESAASASRDGREALGELLHEVAGSGPVGAAVTATYPGTSTHTQSESPPLLPTGGGEDMLTNKQEVVKMNAFPRRLVFIAKAFARHLQKAGQPLDGRGEAVSSGHSSYTLQTSRMREQATTGSLQITTRYEVSPDDQDHPTLGVLPPYYNHDRTNDFRFLPAGIL